MTRAAGSTLWSAAFLACLAVSAQDEFGEKVRIAKGLVEARDYAAAEKLYLEALNETPPSGAPSLRSAVILNNLGSVSHQLNRLVAAEHWYRQAIETFEKVADPGLPLSVVCASNFAEFYLETGQPARALSLRPLLLKHLEASRPTTPGYGWILKILGDLAAFEGRVDEAEELFSRALESRDALEPDGHLMMYSLNNLGALKQKRGKSADALALFEKASEICETKCPTGSPLAPALLVNIATIRLSVNGPHDADPAFARALTCAERTLGPEHELVGTILWHYSRLLRNLKKKELAKQYEGRARAIIQSASAQDPRRHTVSMSDLLRK